MITYLKGKLVHATPAYVVLETGGIGYKSFIPANAYPKLPKIGLDIFLHISFVIRESSQTLYGFLSSEERDFFEKVTTVSGIGPKIALSLIGHLPLDQMHQAIDRGDSKAISKVPGIGKKTAERLIVEMRGKLKTATHSLFSDFALDVNAMEAELVSDALSALLHLGYSRMSAKNAIGKAIKELPTAIDLSTLITVCLKKL